MGEGVVEISTRDKSIQQKTPTADAVTEVENIIAQLKEQIYSHVK